MTTTATATGTGTVDDVHAMCPTNGDREDETRSPCFYVFQACSRCYSFPTDKGLDCVFLLRTYMNRLKYNHSASLFNTATGLVY